MKATIMRQSSSRDPDTGQTTRTWAKDSTEIDCQARSVLGGGIRVVGSTERFSGDNYEDVDWVKMQTSTQLSKRWRITDIRDASSSDFAWSDVDNDGNEAAMVFEVMGSAPVIGPFGDVIEYDNLLYKVQDG